MRVSPFTTLLVDAEMLMVSALSLFPAISKEVLVLVLASKNRFTMVFPLNVGTFLISLVETSMKESAVSKIRLISSMDRSFIPRISFLANFIREPQIIVRLWCYNDKISKRRCPFVTYKAKIIDGN
jgi:hypothetical protein